MLSLGLDLSFPRFLRDCLLLNIQLSAQYHLTQAFPGYPIHETPH